MSTPEGRPDPRRWRARPRLAALVRWSVVLVPVVAATLCAYAVAAALPAPTTVAGTVWRWVVLSGFATVVAVAGARLFRRLLPLATLLRLSLLFPEEAPSRRSVWLGALRRPRATTGAADATATEPGRLALRLLTALSLHDGATRASAERTGDVATLLGRELGVDGEDLERLRWAALVHDVGKVAVHPAILRKTDELRPDEWEELRAHPSEGGRLTAPLHAWLGPWGLAVEQHHERWDGHGYPHGLRRGEISLAARVVAVADAWDAMTGLRPYRTPVDAATARSELVAAAGAQFDPDVVRAFLAVPVDRLPALAGPLLWLLQLPLLRPLVRTADGTTTAATTAVVAAVAAGALVAAPAVPLPAPQAPEAAIAAQDSALASPPALGDVLDATLPDAGADAAGPSPTTPPVTATPPVAPVTPPPPDATAGPAEDGADGGDVTDVAAPPADEAPPPPPSTPAAPPAPRPAVAVDDTAVVDEDRVVDVDVLANDTAGSAGPLRLTSVELVEGAAGSTVRVVGDRVRVTPARDAHGRHVVAYRVADGSSTTGARLVVDVRPVQDAPRTVDDVVTTTRDRVLVVQASRGVLANDVDVDGDRLRVVPGSVDGPSGHGTLTLGEDGAVRFEPAGGTGPRTFTYLVTDGHSAVPATLTVRVRAADWAGGLYLTGEGGTATRSPMTPRRPVATGLPDWDGDGEPGLSIDDSGQKEDEDDPDEFHEWTIDVTNRTRLDGPVRLRLTSAVEELEGEEDVDWSAFLYSCGTGGCTRVVGRRDVHVDDWNEEDEWSVRTLDLGVVRTELEPGTTLRLKLLFGHERVWLPLTKDRPSVLLLPTG